MEKKLLIVDDDFAIRSFLDEALKDAGFNLTWREYQMAHEIVPEEVDAIKNFLNSSH